MPTPVFVTPKLKRAVIAAVEATLSTCPPDVFGQAKRESAIERAKARPLGKQLIKDHTLRAKAFDLDFLELMVEVYGDVLKERKVTDRKQKEAAAEKNAAASLRRELKSEAKKQAAHEANKAQRKAQRDTAKRENSAAQGEEQTAANDRQSA